MSNTRKQIASRLGIAARLGSKLKMEMSPYDFKVAKSDLLFYIKDNLKLLADQQKQLGRINPKQLSPEDVAMAKQVMNEIQSFKSQLTALQAKANAVSDLKTAQQEIASLMTQLTRTADPIRPKVSGPISALQQAAQRAQVRTAVQNEPRIPGWIRIMKDQIRQAEKGAKGFDRKSDARDAYDQLIQSLQWIVRSLLNNDARQVNGAIFDLKTTRMPPAPDNNWRDWVPDDMVKWAATESKGRNAKAKMAASISKHGHKVRAGIMDRIGAAASALTASPADPTSPQYRQQLAAAKKTAQDAVGNYKFMRDKVKGRQDAMDKYVGAAIKTINASTNVQDVEHFAEQIQIAVRALSTMLSSVKTPFARPGAKATAAKPSDLEREDVKAGGQMKSARPGASVAFNLWTQIQRDMIEKKAPPPNARAWSAAVTKEIALARDLAANSSSLGTHKALYRQQAEALSLLKTAVVRGDKKYARGIIKNLPTEITEDLPADLIAWAQSTDTAPRPSAKAKDTAPRPGAKATAAKPSDLEREDVKAGLKLMAASDEAVSNKIRTLIAEGKPQDQAVAIALDMKRRGEI
jgi:hypothetical protein